jgi:hypothetical protein
MLSLSCHTCCHSLITHAVTLVTHAVTLVTHAVTLVTHAVTLVTHAVTLVTHAVTLVTHAVTLVTHAVIVLSHMLSLSCRATQFTPLFKLHLAIQTHTNTHTYVRIHEFTYLVWRVAQRHLLHQKPERMVVRKRPARAHMYVVCLVIKLLVQQRKS